MAIQVELNPALSPGEWLTQTRDARGLRTDIELARAAGALTPDGRSLIAGFRAGRGPSRGYVPGLAAALHVTIADVMEHLWGERPGDCCGCGCLGVKVVPEDPAARKLVVVVPCQECGTPRRYRQGTEHFPLCQPCSLKGIIRFAGDNHPAGPVIRAALDRLGLTLVQAEELAGFRQGQVARWLGGRRYRDGVFHDQLQRLVDVLKAPELFDVIPWRWRYIVFTCKCRRTQKILRSKFEAGQRRGFHAEADFDEATGTGTWRCQRCLQSEAGRRSPVGREIAKVRKRGGRKALRERMPKLTLRQRQEYAEKARAARRVPMKEESRWRHAVGQIRRRPVGRWGLCRGCGCGYVAFSKHRHLNEHGEFVYRPVLMHQTCQDEYRREHQRAFGQPPHPPRPEGQHLSPEKIADAFEMAVRHLLRGEPIIDSDEAVTDVEKRGIVPREFGLNSRRAVEKRIDTFIDQLPPDDRGGKRLSFWARALREAKEKRSSRPRGL